VHRKEVFQRIAASLPSNDLPEGARDGSFRPVRVLIADPDECLVDSYRACLEQHGFEVVVAASGLECVERLRDSAPDVLVLEPVLPWGGGDGVLAMMREEPDVPRVPVIALTVGHDRGVLYRLAPFPIDDFQVKPLSGDRLVQRVRAVVKRRPADARPARIPR
jgi:two-component system OmpR family response regulator